MKNFQKSSNKLMDLNTYNSKINISNQAKLKPNLQQQIYINIIKHRNMT